MIEIGAASSIIQLYLIALAVAIPRAYAMFTFLPVTTRLGLPEMLRAVVVIAITLPILQPLAAEVKKGRIFLRFLCSFYLL